LAWATQTRDNDHAETPKHTRGLRATSDEIGLNYKVEV